MIRLDTHVALWLYTGQVERLSPLAAERLANEVAVISPMVELELQYLHEIDRIGAGGADVVADLIDRIGLKRSDTTFGAVVSVAAALRWTRDPFDRLIVADSIVSNESLLTKDRRIISNLPSAIW